MTLGKAIEEGDPPVLDATIDPTVLATDPAVADPVALGVAAPIGDWHVTVVATSPFAEGMLNWDTPRDDLLSMSAGEQLLMVRLQVLFTGDHPAVLRRTLLANLVDGASGERYQPWERCRPYDPLPDDGAVPPGGVIEGELCWKVPTGDSSSLLLELGMPRVESESLRFELFPAGPSELTSLEDMAALLNQKGVPCQTPFISPGYSTPRHEILTCHSSQGEIHIHMFDGQTVLDTALIRSIVPNDPVLVGDNWIASTWDPVVIDMLQLALGGNRLESPDGSAERESV